MSRFQALARGFAPAAARHHSPALAARSALPALRTGSSQSRRLFEFLDDAGAFQPRNMVDEEDAVQMVDLVLQAGRENAVGLDLLPRGRRGRDSRRGRAPGARPPRNIRGSTGSPLRKGRVLRTLQRISGLARHIGIGRRLRRVGSGLALGDVEDDDAGVDRDLRRGEADAGRVIHGLQHVIHQRADPVVHGGDGPGDEAQAAVGQGDDGAKRHAYRNKAGRGENQFGNWRRLGRLGRWRRFDAAILRQVCPRGG